LGSLVLLTGPMSTVKVQALRPIASPSHLELAYPANEKGLGAVILTPESPGLISGVRVQPFPICPDGRGYSSKCSASGAV
jgi:hypothetical protein